LWIRVCCSEAEHVDRLPGRVAQRLVVLCHMGKHLPQAGEVVPSDVVEVHHFLTLLIPRPLFRKHRYLSFADFQHLGALIKSCTPVPRPKETVESSCPSWWYIRESPSKEPIQRYANRD